MRFILKSAFWLGLIAFLIPFGGQEKETSANITTLGLFLGAQQAIADVTGFCDRAPMACDTGRELAVFAGERIGDGIAMAYALVEGRIDDENGNAGDRDSDVAALPPAPAPAVSGAGTTGATDPLATGTVGATAAAAPQGPSAYIPPKRSSALPNPAAPHLALPTAAAPMPPAFDAARLSMDEAPAIGLAVPTPAPRP